MKNIPLVTLFSVIVLWPSVFAQQTFDPPKVTSAGDAYVPYQVVMDGLFVLDVRLNDDGEIRRIEALRDPGAMLGAAKTSVHAWKFQPAYEDGKPTVSRQTVAFLYRPANQGNAVAVPPMDFVPVIPSDQSDDGDYVPVGISSFAYPDYPVNSVAWGSVVVQVTVNSVGHVKDVNFLYRTASFDNFVLDALKRWRFRAAILRGKPVTSKTVIAFVFQPPPSTN
jgi:TonB family protein